MERSRTTTPVVVIGSSAAGMAAAVAARRQDSTRGAVLLERLPYYAFASCGLPEVLKGNLPDTTPLLHRDPAELGERYGVTVLLQQEVTRIFPGPRKLLVQNLLHEREYELEYGSLIIATGARPQQPDRPGFHTLRYPHELDEILQKLRTDSCRRVNISGSGILGLTLIDALLPLEKDLHLYSRDTILSTFPEEISLQLTALLKEKQVQLHPRQEAPPDGPDQLTLLAHGVKPYLPAGLAIGRNWEQGVPVDRYCLSDVDAVYACGECALMSDSDGLTGAGGAAAANRQGKIAGINATGGRERFNGVDAVLVEVDEMVAGRAGMTLSRVKQERQPVATVSGNFRLLPVWMGKSELFMRLDYRPADGTLLSFHACGAKGVAARVNQVASWMQAGVKLSRLSNLQMAYHPAFSAVTDPLAALLAKAVSRS